LDDLLPALAYHFARCSAPTAETPKAVAYASRAGDRALAQLAHDEAAGYYCQALELLKVVEGPADHDDQRLKLLISLGEAQRRAGHPAYRETLLAAAALAEKQGDGDALARAALASHRGIFSNSDRVDSELVAVLEAALRVTSCADSETRARLLANLASELTWSADDGRRSGAVSEALAMARRLGDQATLAHVLLQGYPLFVPGDATKLTDYAAELTDVGVQSDDPAVAFWAAYIRSFTALSLGDTTALDSCLVESGRMARELGQPFLRYLVTLIQSTQRRIAGRLGEAEALAQDALEVGQASGIPESYRVYAENVFWIRYDQGRLDTLADGMERAAARKHRDANAVAATAVAFCELGRSEEARSLFEQFASDDFAYPSNFNWLYVMTLMAETCSRLADVHRAAVLFDRLAPYHQFVPHNGAGTSGAVSYHLGLLATTLGRHDEADAHFDAAHATHTRMGAPTLLARTRLEWARMLLTRRATGDAERARELLGQALTTARELGLSSVERRGAALLSHLE
jgi:tetratricopeptide (TPR) repeat protein